MQLTDVINLARTAEWNPYIAGTFYRRGHIETWGRGTNKIAELLKQAGRAPFTVASDEHAFTFTFPLPPRHGAVNGTVNGTVNGAVNNARSNSPSQVLQFITEHPGQRTQAIADALGIPRRSFQRVIKQLRDLDQIEFAGSPKTGGYRTKTPTTRLQEPRK